MNYSFVDLIYGFNRDLLGVQQEGIRTLRAKELEYAKICLREEMDELVQTVHPASPYASVEDLIVDQIDALVDALYFSVGHIYRSGVSAGIAREGLERSASIMGLFEFTPEERTIMPLEPETVASFSSRILVNADRLAGQSVTLDLAQMSKTIITSLEGLFAIGLTREQAFRVIEIVDEKNKQKKKGVNAKRDLGVEDVIKPDGWTSPESAIKQHLFGAA